MIFDLNTLVVFPPPKIPNRGTRLEYCLIKLIDLVEVKDLLCLVQEVVLRMLFRLIATITCKLVDQDVNLIHEKGKRKKEVGFADCDT